MGMANSDDEARIMREHHQVEFMKKLLHQDHSDLSDDERARAEYDLLQKYKALRDREPCGK